MGNTKKKNTTNRDKETLRKRGTKRYQERIVEEKEAEKDIKEYENRTDERGSNRPDGLGPFGC